MLFYKLESNSRKFVIYGVIFFLLFCFVFWRFAEELQENELHHFDFTIISWVQSFITIRHTEVMEVFTFLGSYKAVITVTVVGILLMWRSEKKWESLFFSIAVSGSSLFNLLLKWIFHRARPTIHPLIHVTGYSFPSGHSMGSFVLYGMLTYFLVLFSEKRTAKVATILFFSVLVLAIGVSRIYLGVHYPSDVLAGFAAGGAWTILCLLALKIILEKRQAALKKKGSML